MESTEVLVDAAGDLNDEEGVRGDDAIHMAAGPQIGADHLAGANGDRCAAASPCSLHVAKPVDVDN